MAHYAFLDQDNIVTEVIVGRNEDEVVNEVSDWEQYYGQLRGQRCIRTSYNNNIRGVYAGIGYSYNEEEDIFITPKPYQSWTRNGSFWEPPIPMPNDEKIYKWNEDTVSWISIN